MKHEKIVEIREKFHNETTNLPFYANGAFTSKYAKWLENQIAQLYAEQLEPEGEICNCDSDHICGICWERKGFRFIGGELTPPPQQPSDSAGEEVYVECDEKEMEYWANPKYGPTIYLKKLTRPTVSLPTEERLNKLWTQFSDIKHIEEAGGYNEKEVPAISEANFKAAIKELNR